ncbi:unnamed protein product [Hymenolepis diminuta]|uniref:SH3 domain-containing protein n=1 Tax=Hymenolepis diminuta TaxID=6216 RepID=A0A0R3SX63_HYMDI|nr:unnamed protein product [Hymenolepis diminuta]
MENLSPFTSTTSTGSTTNTTNSANSSNTASENTTILARALFDNTAEVSQELTFTRGDVLTVLKKDPPGFEGWWICNLAGKVGIAPGNRLEILGSVKPKNKPSTSRSTPPANVPTKIVKVLVNPLETDPYDELPTVFEVPPAVPPHPNKTEQSFYANLYENYPTGGASEGRNGSPHSRQPSSSPRPTSPKAEEIPGKTVSFFGPASMNTKTTLPVMQASTDLNSRHNQVNTLPF